MIVLYFNVSKNYLFIIVRYGNRAKPITEILNNNFLKLNEEIYKLVHDCD